MKKTFLWIFAALLLLAGVFVYAQIPADQAVTRPDHIATAGDLGVCNEAETEYNIVTHLKKSCLSGGNAWGTHVLLGSGVTPTTNAIPYATSTSVFGTLTGTQNQALIFGASGLPTSATVGDPNLTANTAFGLSAQRVCHAQYSFTNDGGAVGTITPLNNCTLPANAVITNVAINSTTAVTSGGSATVAVGTTAGSSATSLLAATAKASFTANAFVQAVPVPATASTWVKMSAQGQPNITVATAALTAGIIEIYVFYYVSST
jgi:hypothetical protein